MSTFNRGRGGAFVRRISRPAVVALGILGVAGLGHAFELETGNQDLKVRFDNTVRLNAAWRMQNRNPTIAGNFAYDEGEFLFDKYDNIGRRIDLLTEIDVVWQNRLGARVTGAAWFDGAYGDGAPSNPAISIPPSYRNNRYSAYTKRFYRGPSGEILDAFVFGNFNLGATPVEIKAGRHAVVWGESLFGSTHAIAYSQVPSDSRKSLANPGASAKETALPISQISVSARPTSELNLVGQYGLEWRSSRFPEGGTFFEAADFVLEGPNAGRNPPIRGRSGDIGFGATWSPAWLDGTLGFFARKFDEKTPWGAQFVAIAPVLTTMAVYQRDVRLLGMSLSKNIGGVSVGAEVSHRRNDALNSSTTATAGPGGGFAGASGNTWHGLVNGIMTFGSSPLFSSATLVGEVAWSKLDKVTKDRALYRAPGFNATCNSGDLVMKGCTLSSFTQVGVSFTPTWTQLFPSTDVSLPLFVQYNPRGNAPSNLGGSEGFLVYKAGVSFSYLARHFVDIAYTGYKNKLNSTTGAILGAPYNDKGWLSVTYQTTF